MWYYGFIEHGPASALLLLCLVSANLFTVVVEGGGADNQFVTKKLISCVNTLALRFTRLLENYAHFKLEQ